MYSFTTMLILLIFVGLCWVWFKAFHKYKSTSSIYGGDVYNEFALSVAAFAAITTFFCCWIYCIVEYGFLWGFGLGWIPSVLCAGIAVVLVPIAYPLILPIFLYIFPVIFFLSLIEPFYDLAKYVNS